MLSNNTFISHINRNVAACTLVSAVIIYSAFYDTQEGAVGMLMLRKLPHGIPVFCL